MASLRLNYVLKGLSLNTVLLGGWSFTIYVLGDTLQSIVVMIGNHWFSEIIWSWRPDFRTQEKADKSKRYTMFSLCGNLATSVG